MINNQLAPERISDISDYFVEMQDHYSDPADRENFEIFRDAELLMKELQERRNSEMDSEPVVFTDERNLHHIAMGRETSLIWGKQNSEAGDIPLYRHAQQPVVSPELTRERYLEYFMRDDWRDNFRSGWEACRAAMLQAGNSPVIPDGLIAAVNRLLDSDGSRGCYSAIRCHDARAEVERLLAAAPHEVKP